MLTSLLLLASPTVAMAGPSTHPEPPVHVWYNSDGDFVYGDRAKVYVKPADDGYLVVLRAASDGRVRVLFPLDPDDDQRVQGGKKYELKGRGGREAFVVADTTGQGVVLAAYSKTPFQLEQFQKNGQWDLAALSGQNGEAKEDAEARLVSLVDQMKSRDAHFDYDLAVYTVGAPRYARAYYPYPYGWQGWWGYNPWWGFGPPLLRTRVFVPVGRFGIGGRMHL